MGRFGAIFFFAVVEQKVESKIEITSQKLEKSEIV